MSQPIAEAHPLCPGPCQNCPAANLPDCCIRCQRTGKSQGQRGRPGSCVMGIYQCMTARTWVARAAARECSFCERGPAPIEVRCRHSNASRAALWLQQKDCAAASSLCSKGDITTELAGRLFLLTPHVVALSVLAPGLGIIEPCLPSPAKAPPSGPGWLHEIKHDGFRILRGAIG
jgi:hypothetical protein